LLLVPDSRVFGLGRVCVCIDELPRDVFIRGG
jgi:hypothetical protein